jgi:carbamoyl-phosphate synthase small subunit
MSKGFLILETGESFEGRWHGRRQGGDSETTRSREATRAGELVFNTSHAGYQEIASDPSYFGQIMVMTAPMQGNYGEHAGERESDRYWIEGFVCLEIENRDPRWIHQLLDQNIPVLSEVDTRALTLRLRQGGAVFGGLCAAATLEEAREKTSAFIAQQKKRMESDLTQKVCVPKPQVLKGRGNPRTRLAVLDFGAKANILRELSLRAGEIKVFPSFTEASEIREFDPSGILLSNGPGDPALVRQGVQTVRELLGWRPIFGICMGHQVLSLALNGKTFKMKFGHHGGNHPVRDLLLEKVYVTSQNHGYAVDPGSLPEGTRVTHTNLYDGTVEGFEYPQKKCWSVQYHPESAPGPNDARNLFDVFVGALK